MALYCSEADGDTLIEGTNKCMVVRHKDNNHIEIWDEDGEIHFGNVPSSFTVEQINVAVSFYRSGWSTGRIAGASEKQQEVRRVLGLN